MWFSDEADNSANMRLHFRPLGADASHVVDTSHRSGDEEALRQSRAQNYPKTHDNFHQLTAAFEIAPLSPLFHLFFIVNAQL